jgi:hypothetical protein
VQRVAISLEGDKMKWNEVYFEHGKFRHIVLPVLGILCGEHPHAMYFNANTPEKFKKLPSCPTCWKRLQDYL